MYQYKVYFYSFEMHFINTVMVKIIFLPKNYIPVHLTFNQIINFDVALQNWYGGDGKQSVY